MSSRRFLLCPNTAGGGGCGGTVRLSDLLAEGLVVGQKEKTRRKKPNSSYHVANFYTKFERFFNKKLTKVTNYQQIEVLNQKYVNVNKAIGGRQQGTIKTGRSGGLVTRFQGQPGESGEQSG